MSNDDTKLSASRHCFIKDSNNHTKRHFPESGQAGDTFVLHRDKCGFSIGHRVSRLSQELKSITIIYVWRDDKSMAQFLASLCKHPAPDDTQLIFPRNGRFDLGVYRNVAKRLKTEFVCCLNTHARIMADNWLQQMMSPFETQENESRPVGLVGTTASAESFYTNALKRNTRFSEWRRLFFPPAPNWHIRTNGFVMRRKLLLELFPRWFPTKEHCYMFESGHKSLTKRVWSKGLQCVVVGKDGPRKLDDGWDMFRSGNQSNLLISDKQTRLYDAGDEVEREYLQSAAWDK